MSTSVPGRDAVQQLKEVRRAHRPRQAVLFLLVSVGPERKQKFSAPVGIRAFVNEKIGIVLRSYPPIGAQRVRGVPSRDQHADEQSRAMWPDTEANDALRWV